jgi:putative nucleotidyltransferase with HDIG domain
MHETIRAGQVWRSEAINRRKDGSVYTGEITVAPVRDENGEIANFIDVEQDITERKQHERELEAIVVVANALRNAKTRSEMLPVILDQLLDLLNAEGASIALYDPTTDEMTVTLARGPFAGSSGAHFNAREGLTGVVINSRQIYLSPCPPEETVMAGQSFGHPYAIAGVPLITQEQLVGVIWLVRSTEINPTEARLLTAIADIAASAIYRASLYEETEQRLQRITALREIDKAITASLDLRVTLSVLVDQVISQLDIDASDVLLFTPETQSLEYAVGIGFRHVFPRTTRLLSQNYANRAVMERRVIGISNLTEDNPELMEKMRSRGEDFVAYFAVPLISKGQVKGVLELFKRVSYYPNPEWLNFLEMLAGQAAIAIDNAELFENLQRSNINLAMAYDDTIEGWSRTLELRDQETEGHTQRVTEMAVRLARAYGIREADLVHIRRGALLHDIGKMGIPDNILLKPGPLTPDEWEVIRKHPVYAYELLSPIEFLRSALDIPFAHHERWDGNGYPRGLKGEQIPIAARIFSIIDVYDALVNERPYREAWHRERVLAYLRGQSGKHFDPKVVDLFLTADW